MKKIKGYKSFNESLDSSEVQKMGDELISDLKKGIRMYGEYSYHDKGADEVMNVRGWMNKLNKLTVKELGNILSYVLDNHTDSQNLVDHIISDSDHREESEFGELLDMDERFFY